ncbi:MAG: ABC-F family ATP-binding cassette domain-containing protein [Lachnospiraceae bacterium]|nr:ABC-F family ATP-binding cassette domain-containing protein [Lachnospiraceae bacterium]
MLYQITNGTVKFSDHVILHDINFEIRNTEKIAVVGRNGCGKTTLLKLISGEVELEEINGVHSSISSTGNPQIGFLKQVAFEDTSILLEDEIRKSFAPMIRRKEELEALAVELEHDHSDTKVARYTMLEEAFKEDGGYYFEKEYDVMVRKFGFSEEERRKPLSDFSGGQQTKIAFIKLLLSKPDILLLDEPTNHLDITTIEWLEGYLRSYPKAVVLVSHDRMFLDNIADVVYEIEYGTAKRYPGNYTNFVARKKENYEKQLKDYNAQQKEIARLTRMVERFKGKPTKTSMAQSKEKAIEHMEKIESPDKADLHTFHANFQPLIQTGKDVLSVSELAIGYDRPLSVISLELKRGEKLGIVGGNGLGKSTFLKTLVGLLDPLSGGYRYGVHAQIGYFDQQMAMFRSDKTVLDDYWDEFPTLTETEVRNALGAFLFTGEDVFKEISMLSGGEKVRLALCKIFKRRPNILILDEPTNHMDIVGKETLETMLAEYTGTLIFVSHDRYFVKKIATQILAFEDGTTHLYRFGFDEYQEHLNASLSGASEDAKAGADREPLLGGVISTNASRTKRQTGVKAYNNPGKERSKLERKVQKAEEQLEAKEEQLTALKEELLLPEYASSYTKLTEIQAQIDVLETEIAADMEIWEELSSQLEEISED